MRSTVVPTFPSLIPILASMLCIACGHAKFQGSNGLSDNSKRTPSPAADDAVLRPTDPSKPGTVNLNWHWECADTSNALSPTEYVGPGPHQIRLDDVQSLSISLDGNFCSPPRDPRDITFVVDVSASMTSASDGNPAADPLTNTTCARLETIQQVIAMAIQTGDAKFSTVTFSSLTQQASANFHSSQASMFAELLASSGSGIENILCAGLSGTSYQAGLSTAQDLVNKARNNALKEVFLISDGAPSPNEDGIAQATAIKSKATILTVMLGSANDAVLRESIATKDPNGTPLHSRAANASALAGIVKRMASNGIHGGKLKYRTLGASTWQEIDMKPHIVGNKFALPATALEIQGAAGVEVEYTYWDLHNRQTTKSGVLKFVN